MEIKPLLTNNFTDISICPENTIMGALKQMDSHGRRLLLVFKNKVFKGVLSIGDIQRAIIKNTPLESMIGTIMRDTFTIARVDEEVDMIKRRMLESRIEFIPVLNYKDELVNVLFWEDFFKSKIQLNLKSIELPVVIMAGGRGTRLQPFTNTLPKPLLPFEQSTIIETIINNFKENGSKEFYLSIYYKGHLIKDYINNRKEGLDNLKINFLEETEPLGSAGSLFMLRNSIKSSLWISNCDIIINEDYSLIHEYHIKNSNDITIVAAVKQLNIPYGVVESGEEGILNSYIEKPDLSFKINSGMYLIEPSVLMQIPENKFYNFSDLINDTMRSGKVGVFPVSENSWKDVGSIDNYYSVINKSTK